MNTQEKGEMFLVHYFDQAGYEFHMSLHSTRAAAEAAYEQLLQRYVFDEGQPLPPKSEWFALHDDQGEGVQLYRVVCDGEPAEQVHIEEDAVAA
jgi:hypothetical protein